MKGIILILTVGLMMSAMPSHAGEPAGSSISKIIAYKASLGLTDSQVKKLEIIDKTSQEKMTQAKIQADIRFNEIEKFTSNWTDMNSMAVNTLIKEYYDYLADYKSAEVGAIVQARAILEMNQLAKFQQLVSIETLMLKIEPRLASAR